MFRFLYMFGPGALSWLVCRKCSKMDEEKNVLYILIEIISYSFVNMTVMTTVFKRMGRITFITLSDGTLDVYYGATALLASMVFALVLGRISSWIDKNILHE